MADSKLPALIIPEGFGRAAEKLADTVHHVVNLVSGPDRVRAQAQARADAAIIEARAKTEIADIQERARHRLMNRELRRQSHIEQITVKAVAALPPSDQISDKPVDEDWVTRFFEECQDINDEQMQDIWARILAGEVAGPGTFSPRTLSVVRDLTRLEAELFNAICSSVWVIDVDTTVPVIFDLDSSLCRDHKISFSTLTHMTTLGLITFSRIASYASATSVTEVHASYFGETYSFKRESAQSFPLGMAILTGAGHELNRVLKGSPNEAWRTLALHAWKQDGWINQPVAGA